jgi:hypothetical protein
MCGAERPKTQKLSGKRFGRRQQHDGGCSGATVSRALREPQCSGRCMPLTGSQTHDPANDGGFVSTRRRTGS